jgi:hypothetical protein
MVDTYEGETKVDPLELFASGKLSEREGEQEKETESWLFEGE